MHWTPGLSVIPLLWGRHRIWFHFSAYGTSLCGLREEIEAGVFGLSCSTGWLIAGTEK